MRHAATLLTLALALPAAARACSTPVFRYALERWRPSPYEVFVSHREPFGRDEPGVIFERLKSARLSNLTVHPAVHGPEARVQVNYPGDGSKAAPAWSASLDGATYDRLLASPARTALIDRLLAGESAVWLLLTGDDRRADAAALALLRRELARLARELTLPDRTDDEASQLLSDLPLRLSFAVVTVDRRAPREAFFARSLLGSRDDLAGVKGPVVFPVIGRGRALTALHGPQLTAERVEFWASFLCAACSCRVKDLNPGFDLLLTADWDGRLNTPAAKEELSRPDGAKATVPIPPGSPPADAPRQPPRRGPWQWAALAGWVALVAGAAVWVWRRGPVGKNA